MKKAIILILMLFLFPYIVCSVKEVQINDPSDISSLTIVYPKDECTLQDSDSDLSFDILDSNFTKLDDTNTNCSFVSINSTGDIVTSGSLVYDSDLGYWQYNLDTSATAELGYYNYYVYCNSSNTENGYISSTFEVDGDGYCDALESTSAIAIILIPIVFGFFALLGAMSMGEAHDVLRIGLFIFSLSTVWVALWLGSIIISINNIFIQDALGTVTNLFGWVIAVIIFYFLIYAFYTIVHRIGKQKEQELEY